MRVAVVFYPVKNRDKILKVSKALAKGLESQGFQVDLIDAGMDVNSKLTIYQYIAFGTEVPGLFNQKLPRQVGDFLKNSGMVAGKRCFGYILPKPLFAAKSLNRLMSVMEGEGMFLKFSEVIGDEALAEEIGKKLVVQH